VRGQVAFHRGDLDAARGFFAEARRLCDRVLSARELHPDIARLYREAHVSNPAAEAGSIQPGPLGAADVADILFLDAVAVVRGAEGGGGLGVAAAVYDGATGRWPPAVTGDLAGVAAALAGSPALSAAQPELVVPPDPPLPAPPRFYQRGWFW